MTTILTLTCAIAILAWGVTARKLIRAKAELAKVSAYEQIDARTIAATRAKLRNLRTNCFLTNERGHRVKYANASPERRDAAERGVM